MPDLSSQLTRGQRWVLEAVQRMQDGPDEYGHDAEGDLSMCTGNLTRTLRVLRGRGLIDGFAVREPDDYYTEIRLTPTGREAIA